MAKPFATGQTVPRKIPPACGLLAKTCCSQVDKNTSTYTEEAEDEVDSGLAGAELDPIELGPVAIGGEELAAADVVGPAGLEDTGQTVVLMAMTDVTTLVDEAGQFVTVGAQLVTV